MLFFVLSMAFIEAASAGQINLARALVYVFVIVPLFAGGILLRLRLNDCDWPSVLVLLFLFPITGIGLWVVLFFIPTKRQRVF